MIAADLVARIQVLVDLGLGYLSLNRRTPTVSPGELQRLRLATQLRAGLFGVLYVLDEPSAGLHPADAEPLLDVLDRLRRAGNSLFVVEHDMDVVRRADWIVDVGPGAGELGGEVLYSGPVPGLADVEASVTRRYLFGDAPPPRPDPAHAVGTAAAARHLLPQSARPRRRHPARRLHRGHRGVRLGQVDARLQGARRRRRPPSGRRRASSPKRRRRSGSDAEIVDLDHDASIGVTADGVEVIDRLVTVDQRADRAHAAFEPRHLHRHVRRRPARRSPRRRGAPARLDARAGSRSTSPRAAARPVRARASSRSNCCSCPALTPPARPATAPATTTTTLRGALPRPHDRRRAGDDRRRGGGVPRRRPRRGAQPDDAARGRAGLPAPRAARDRAVRRRGAAHQAGVRTAAAPSRTHALRARRADHRAAPRRRRAARRGSCTASSTRATPWWSPSTTCGWSPERTG